MNTASGVQSLASTNICKAVAPQGHVTLVKERPGLMAFYDRLKAKVFPNGPSENWAIGCWDPKKHASVAC